MKRIQVILAVVLPLVVVAALPAVSDPQGPSYARDVEPIIVKRCADCHTADKPKAHLILEKGRGYGLLVGRNSVEVPTVPLVKPGDPDGSYLWRKLKHTASKGKGMPRSLFWWKKLPRKELALIRSWIEAGALP